MDVTLRLTIDCAYPARLVTFWTEALGYVPEPAPDGPGPRIWFQRVPEGKTVKNRVHLDLKAGGGRGVPLPERTRRIRAKADRLTSTGATVLRIMDEPDMDYYGVVLRDPEGNEFCVA